jgi:prepilin-type N-terminal cleavage/methylation domain-containing protein
MSAAPETDRVNSAGEHLTSSQDRPPAPEEHLVRDERADGGFTLVEVIVALGIITVVMTSLTVFMVNSRHSGHYSALRDTAVQLTVEGMEKARGVRGSALLSGRAQCTTSCAPVVAADVTTLLGSGVTRWDAAATTGTLTVPAPGTQSDGSVVDSPDDPEVVTLDGIAYQRYYYVGACYQPSVTTVTASLTCGPATAAAPLVRLVVTVTWTGGECPGGTCAYSEAGLFSTAVTDPYLGG